jgi:translation initiation factor 4A
MNTNLTNKIINDTSNNNTNNEEEKKNIINDDSKMNESKYSINSWDDLECDLHLLRGIHAIGFENPSPIQKKAILPMNTGRDIIAQAQSGTGKTGCFSIGTLMRLDLNNNATQVIVLSPTHELTNQTKSVIDKIGSYMKGLKTKSLIGGVSVDNDVKYLKNNKPHIVLGCPGRIHDMLKRRRIETSNLKLLVIDEADELLSNDFKSQIYNIFQHLPDNIQVALFSATLPNDLINITKKFMRNPIEILVKSEQLTLEGIKQYYIALDRDDDKYNTLKDLYNMLTINQCIIYCNSVNRVQDLYEAMIAENFPVCRIHSKMSKEERNTNYEGFKSGSQRVLISSNVTARGVDIQQVSVVINFDVPNDVYTYLHRIGRSGRWGRKGTGINFVTKRDINKMKNIEEYYSTEIMEMPANVNL